MVCFNLMLRGGLGQGYRSRETYNMLYCYKHCRGTRLKAQKSYIDADIVHHIAETERLPITMFKTELN